MTRSAVDSENNAPDVMLTISFDPVYAAYEGCLPRLVGFVYHCRETGRKWYAPTKFVPSECGGSK